MSQLTCRYSHTIGFMAHGGAGFSDPVDVACGPDNLLYVLNRSNPYDGPLGGTRLVVCTVGEEFRGEIGSYGTGDGQFVWPTGIAADGTGQIYITDEYRHDVQVLDEEGRFLRRWGGFGEAIGQLNRPSGIAVDRDGTLIVVDHLNHRVQRFTPDGRPLVCWGVQGAREGELEMPWGVTLDAQGHVYVADWGNHRVVKFTSAGEYVATFGEPTMNGPDYGSEIAPEFRGQISGAERHRALMNRSGQLNRPAGVAVDFRGNVYVADDGDDRVQIFAPSGQPLETLYGSASLSKWAAQYLAGNQEATRANPQDALVERRKIIDLEPEKSFWSPRSVRIDNQERLLIVDCARCRIQVFETT